MIFFLLILFLLSLMMIMIISLILLSDETVLLTSAPKLSRDNPILKSPFFKTPRPHIAYIFSPIINIILLNFSL